LNLRIDHDLDPVLNVTVTGETAINPSEDVQKVMRCIINTINGGDQSVKRNYVVVRTKGLLALHHIRVGIKLRQSARVLQRLVEYNRDGNSTWFLLNKQAAYCGIIAIVESWHESSLGPIKVTIQSSDLDRLLTWLIPPVIKGSDNKFHGSELKAGDTFTRSKRY
jgi:uncharacterized protein